MQAATKVAARVPAKSRVHAIFVVFQWPSCCASHSYPKLLDASSMPPAPFQAGVIPSLPSPTGVPGHEVQLRSSAKIIRDHAESTGGRHFFSKPLANGRLVHNQCFVCGKSAIF